jgi:hypothetical protein
MIGDENTKLLKEFFTDDEWDYLKSIDSFVALVSGSKDSIDDVERLVSIGGCLLHEAEGLKSKQKAAHPLSTCGLSTLRLALGSASRHSEPGNS